MVILLAIVASLPLCAAEQKTSIADTAEYLISTVAKSDATFVRNGSNYTAKEASEHMRRKYDHFKKEIKTPEDFIEKCASKSEMSGKPYTVKFADGKNMRCDEWMKKLLAERKVP